MKRPFSSEITGMHLLTWLDLGVLERFLIVELLASQDQSVWSSILEDMVDALHTCHGVPQPKEERSCLRRGCSRGDRMRSESRGGKTWCRMLGRCGGGAWLGFGLRMSMESACDESTGGDFWSFMAPIKRGRGSRERRDWDAGFLRRNESFASGSVKSQKMI